MEFLEEYQICAWAEPHPPKAYAQGRRSGQEADAALDLIAGLGGWDDCLVWITLWGVWPSGEDWPDFYAWRGSLGEHRSIDVAPGHRFERGELTLLARLLELIMKNAWGDGRADQVRGKVSHDEWYQVLGSPTRPPAAK